MYSRPNISFDAIKKQNTTHHIFAVVWAELWMPRPTKFSNQDDFSYAPDTKHAIFQQKHLSGTTCEMFQTFAVA